MDRIESAESLPITLSVVVPVYNEEKNLNPLHSELRAVMEKLGMSYELVFVDDGSTDNTYAQLEALFKADKATRVVRFRRNFGQTSAFAAGFDFARGDLIITLDADGQNDPADIPRLLEKLHEGDFDIVIGWRTNRKESFMRRLVSRAANRLISQSSNVVVHDRGCSLKIFKSEIVKQMNLYGQLHRFLPELASVIGVRVAEIPVNDRARQYGKSKYGALTRTPRVILDLITVFFILRFFTSPMRFFGTAALVSGLSGFIIGGWLALSKILAGIVGGWAGFHAYEIGNRPLLLLAILLIMVGVQFLMMGLLGEMIMRTYYEAQGKPTYSVRNILER